MTDAPVEARGVQRHPSNSMKFTILLIAAVSLTILRGIAEQAGIGSDFADLANVVVEAAGLYAVCRKTHQFVIGSILLLLSVSTTLGDFATGHSVATWVALNAGTGAVLFAYYIALIMMEIFDGNPITGDDLLGSICAYLLLATFWANIYVLVQVFVPGAFAQAGEVVEQLPSNRLIYFSFVTLTTLGYGDIVPAEPITEELAVLQAVTGLFYLATLVAALVARSTVGRQHR